MRRFSPTFFLALLALFGSLAAMHFGYIRWDLSTAPQAASPWVLMGFYALAFIAYGFAVIKGNDPLHYRFGLSAGLLLRIMLIFALPNLSDDFYRYIWDGQLLDTGINPYDYTPREWLATLPPATAADWLPLFSHLNSPDYYSVYPPILQGIFAGTVAIGGDTAGAVVAMKLVIILAECGTFLFMHRIARRFQLPHRSVLLYALNPLVISELAGNLHFEALMICFLLGALWMLMVSRPLSAAIFFTLAIGSKLLPLLAFPYLIRRVGWGRTLLLALLTGLLTFGLFFVLMDDHRWAHYFQSIRLYFQSFTFNGGIYNFVAWILGDAHHLLQTLPPIIFAAAVIISAWRERDRIWKGFAAAVMLALALYHMTAPFVHPWYITPLIALCALGPFRFPILWSVLIPLTYLAYGPTSVEEQPWVLAVEYLLLALFLLYEWTFVRGRKTLEIWVRTIPPLRRWWQAKLPARIQTKLHHILPHLSPSETILDLGTGNGALAHALLQQGYQVHPADIKDTSFFQDVRPTLYDGKTLPFESQHFDTTLLISTLHHTPSPDHILDQAIRVTKTRIIIIEDIYTNPIQKYLTYFIDSLLNLEFYGHPHTNRSDRKWQATFQSKGLHLIAKTEFPSRLLLRKAIYILEKQVSGSQL